MRATSDWLWISWNWDCWESALYVCSVKLRLIYNENIYRVLIYWRVEYWFCCQTQTRFECEFVWTIRRYTWYLCNPYISLNSLSVSIKCVTSPAYICWSVMTVLTRWVKNVFYYIYCTYTLFYMFCKFSFLYSNQNAFRSRLGIWLIRTYFSSNTYYTWFNLELLVFGLFRW